MRGRNVLVAGAPRSGKSWVTGLLCEQLILHGYSLCVIDPEGDYTALEPLPDVVVAGGEDPLPRPREVMRTLRHPDVSLVIDLSKRPHAEKRAYVATLLPVLAAMRRRYGVPHRIVLDEAHYFLTEQNVDRMMDLETHGYTLVTYQASSLPRAVLAASEAVIVSQESDLREVEALSGFCARGTADVEAWGRELESLALGDAAILPCAEEAAGTLRRIALVPRLTSHVRHRAKYLDVPVAEGLAFVFTADGRPVERTDTLKRFIEVLGRTPVEHLGGHLRRRDFSRWLDEVYGDHPLARQVNALEEQYRSGLLLDVTDAIVAAVRDRYEVDESSS